MIVIHSVLLPLLLDQLVREQTFQRAHTTWLLELLRYNFDHTHPGWGPRTWNLMLALVVTISVKTGAPRDATIDVWNHLVHQGASHVRDKRRIASRAAKVVAELVTARNWPAAAKASQMLGLLSQAAGLRAQHTVWRPIRRQLIEDMKRQLQVAARPRYSDLSDPSEPWGPVVNGFWNQPDALTRLHTFFGLVYQVAIAYVKDKTWCGLSGIVRMLDDMPAGLEIQPATSGRWRAVRQELCKYLSPVTVEDRRIAVFCAILVSHIIKIRGCVEKDDIHHFTTLIEKSLKSHHVDDRRKLVQSLGRFIHLVDVDKCHGHKSLETVINTMLYEVGLDMITQSSEAVATELQDVVAVTQHLRLCEGRYQLRTRLLAIVQDLICTMVSLGSCEWPKSLGALLEKVVELGGPCSWISVLTVLVNRSRGSIDEGCEKSVTSATYLWEVILKRYPAMTNDDQSTQALRAHVSRVVELPTTLRRVVAEENKPSVRLLVAMWRCVGSATSHVDLTSLQVCVQSTRYSMDSLYLLPDLIKQYDGCQRDATRLSEYLVTIVQMAEKSCEAQWLRVSEQYRGPWDYHPFFVRTSSALSRIDALVRNHCDTQPAWQCLFDRSLKIVKDTIEQRNLPHLHGFGFWWDQLPKEVFPPKDARDILIEIVKGIDLIGSMRFPEVDRHEARTLSLILSVIARRWRGGDALETQLDLLRLRSFEPLPEWPSEAESKAWSLRARHGVLNCHS